MQNDDPEKRTMLTESNAEKAVSIKLEFSRWNNVKTHFINLYS